MLPDKFQEIFSSLEIDPSKIETKMKLEDDLGMDSQEIVELHCAIESVMGVKVKLDHIGRDITVEDLIEKVNALILCHD